MRVGLIGGVESSALTLQKLHEHGLDVVGVFGYKPNITKFVSGHCDLEPFCLENSISGHCDLEPFCLENSISFTPFTKINDHIEEIQSLELDYLFVVGISQLVSKDIIQAPKLGAIGFHPTKLPEGRGRAPLAWLVHEAQEGAATFFYA
ncbi:formyltransferase family protein [Psychrobacter sp. ENNN9_III]|uniref:formyltransferase family protein n=1 Tax=Psychrobacter sp. ENNN9_III TaxID=1254334 RepID=UPI00071E9619|nr:formyltransferase family protein [Psychrobacter sp. ENNN9_III]